MLITRKVSNTYLSSKKDKSLGLANYNLSLELYKDKLEGYSNSCADDEYNNNPESGKDNRRLSPAK